MPSWGCGNNEAMKKQLKNRLLDLYNDTGIIPKVFLRLRLLLAPFFDFGQKIEERQGLVYDLGCGIGILANLLSLSYPGIRVIGIDNSDRISVAKMTRKNKVNFLKADILDFDYAKADAFVMMDILHHLPFDDQSHLLKKIFDALAPGGKLYILDIDVKPILKFWASRFVDCIQCAKTYHRRTDEIISMLEINGYVVEKSEHMHKKRPVSHVFIRCGKCQK